MIEILTHLHQYIPIKEYAREVFIPSLNQLVNILMEQVHPVLFEGDQLTAARARGVKTTMSNGCSAVKKLQGLVPVIEDWHAHVVLLEVCMHTLISKCSAHLHAPFYNNRSYGSTSTMMNQQVSMQPSTS